MFIFVKLTFPTPVLALNLSRANTSAHFKLYTIYSVNYSASKITNDQGGSMPNVCYIHVFNMLYGLIYIK